MARPREFDTQEVIESICDQFWSDGYEATGIADLEDATGLARARLYGAFGSKRGMLCEALDYYLDNKVDVIFQSVDKGGIKGVAGFFRRFAAINAEHPGDVGEGLALLSTRWLSWGARNQRLKLDRIGIDCEFAKSFRSALERDAAKGRLAGNPESLADLAYVMLMGLYVTVKAGAPLEEINRLCGIRD